MKLITKTALTYTRSSTQKQAVDGITIELQQERTDAMAIASGATVTGRYSDIASGSSIDKRPGLSHVMDAVRSKSVDSVIIYSIDRISRSVHDFSVILKEFDENSVSLISVRDSLDTSSAAGRLVTNILMSVAQWEREIISERTKEALAHAKAQGTHLGKPPVGYQVRDGRLEVDPERYRVVQLVHSLREQGLTLAQIARMLEEEGIFTGNGHSNWRLEGVARVLRSPLLEEVPEVIAASM